jgi:hypothetical protein
MEESWRIMNEDWLSIDETMSGSREKDGEVGRGDYLNAKRKKRNGWT